MRSPGSRTCAMFDNEAIIKQEIPKRKREYLKFRKGIDRKNTQIKNMLRMRESLKQDPSMWKHLPRVEAELRFLQDCQEVFYIKAEKERRMFEWLRKRLRALEQRRIRRELRRRQSL